MALPAAEAFNTAGDAAPRPHGNCYWLVPGILLAGEHPGVDGTRWLAAAGISVCIDLTHPQEGLPTYEVQGAGEASGLHLRYPIVDFGVPDVMTLRSIMGEIARACANGQVVYLHCRAGVGRTGTVAACVMVSAGLDAGQALELLQRKWQVVAKRANAPHTPETEAQRLCVLAWQHAGA
jgi:atypical dual specificity phosphatase